MLMVMGRGLGMISSMAHSESLVSVLDMKARLVLLTSMLMLPSDILEIFSDRGISRSAGRDARA